MQHLSRARARALSLSRRSRATLHGFAPCAEVGIAGFVLNSRGQLLVVKEWRDTPDGGRVPSPQWKLPGGLLDRGESFEEGVAREVFEETGVRASFSSLLSFWHRHGLTWGKSDLYYVARMEAESDEIVTQEDEISACR